MVVDIIIVLILLFGVVTGYKSGFISSLFGFIVYALSTIIAFLFKDALASLLMRFLPFFNFYGLIKGATALNILLYEVISFVIIFAIALSILKKLLNLTNLVDKLLSFTIILSFPFKVLGAIFGFIEGFLVVYFLLFIFNMPFLSNEYISESKLNEPILTSTPILSNLCNDAVDASNEIYSLAKSYNKTNPEEFNQKSLEILLKYKITNKETVQSLIDSNKIQINNQEVLNNY